MLEFALPNPHALAVMVLIVVALILFARDSIPLETTSLVVIVALTVGFTLFPFHTERETIQASDFFLGFGHKALVAVCALMILGEGLIRTGALEPVGRFLARLWRRGPAISLLFTLLTTATLSAFINNTPIVVLMLPILIGIGMRTGVSPTGTLIPMGFASILGGMATTIGTSTNLLVVNVAADMGMDNFNMFDFLGPAAIGAGAAILYLWLVVPRMIPERQPPMQDTRSRLYTAQIRIDENSPVVGNTLAEAMERTDENIRVDTVQRGKGAYINPLPDVVLMAGDRITTSDTQANLREFSRVLGGTLFSGDHEVDALHPLSIEGEQLAELVVTPASRLANVRVGDAQLRSRYGVRLLALHRFEEAQERKSPGLDNIQLRSGDVLLVQSTADKLRALKETTDFLILDGSIRLPSKAKAPIALSTIIGVVLLAALNIMPIEISAILGCLVLLVTRCLRWKDAMNALSAQVILIIVSSLAMGAALLKTGGADYLAQLFVYITFGAPPAVVLGGLMLMMGILTNIVSNNAAAVIGTPIAIGIAQRLGMPLEPFVLAVLFGANLSFATPMAYQTNLLIMNAGGYKFGDFVRVGLPLAIGLWLVLTTVLVWAYGM
ncbi:SLC13 family permease [Elongatibacter sediminis]|uniref:SLC13 family permease n=1 Tax=Elongatibacter sediminis TaxID=3119006 RepID=A0AAW9RK00_9GAMM